MASRSATAIVVGGGIFGLTAALELRRRGWAVRLFEGDGRRAGAGASRDVSKLVRMDYGSDFFMTALAELAMAGWDAWNASRSRPLFHEDGILLLSRAPLSPGGFEHDSRQTVLERGHVIRDLDQDAIRSQHPGWAADTWSHGYLNPRAGWVEADSVVEALAADARKAGVRFRREPVRELTGGPGEGTGVVTESGARSRAGVVVVAAGAWTPRLVPWLGRALRPVGQPVLHFRVSEPARWQAPSFPPWAADIAETGWYGFPALADGTLKIGHHGAGLGSDLQAAEVPSEHVDRCRTFLAGSLPALADAPLTTTRVCPYCDSFDGDFWIGSDPDRPWLTVAAGGSGHGFKFAPVLGPLIADVVEGKDNRWGRRFQWRETREEAWEGARHVEAESPVPPAPPATRELPTRTEGGTEQTSLEL